MLEKVHHISIAFPSQEKRWNRPNHMLRDESSVQELMKIEVLFQLLPPNLGDADGPDCKSSRGCTDVFTKLLSKIIES